MRNMVVLATRVLVLLAVGLATALSPCLAEDQGMPSPCPMAGCEKAPSRAVEDCCCKTSRSSGDKSPGVVTPRPEKTTAAPDVAIRPEIEPHAWVPAATTPTPPAEPVPLHLLHATLLI